ncbi:GspH/FimT family pseudopilin [Thermus caliditerrae]|uniref:GspH/FimT family pseudopilin n=1 Tax=Thermus caliditerrae TaxID=1330700 RepID=UPI000ADE65A0
MQKGMTLLELLVVIGILSVLLALVARSDWVAAFRLRSALSEARQAAALARTEAVRREAEAVLEVADGSLRVFLDANGNGEQDAGEPVLREFRPQGVAVEGGPWRFNGVGQPAGAGSLRLKAGRLEGLLCLRSGGAVEEVKGACN